MDYSVNLSTFQGPFDLLFYLIEKREIDIYDIPISEITDQYLQFIDDMKGLNLNITSEFILMAATLIEIKSQMLLPQKEKDDDPRTDLVNQLIEYKLFKEASEKLREFESQSNYYFTKPREEIIPENIEDNEQLLINNVNAYELYNMFTNLLKNQKDIIIHKPIKTKIYRENFSVKVCVDNILIKLKKESKVSVFELFKEKSNTILTKEYIVSVFLAVLELSKMKDITIVQNHTFSDIDIMFKESDVVE